MGTDDVTRVGAPRVLTPTVPSLSASSLVLLVTPLVYVVGGAGWGVEPTVADPDRLNGPGATSPVGRPVTGARGYVGGAFGLFFVFPLGLSLLFTAIPSSSAIIGFFVSCGPCVFGRGCVGSAGSYVFSVRSVFFICVGAMPLVLGYFRRLGGRQCFFYGR